ncbi:MAG TPA: hypothetical protein VKM93_26420, partial [Terriglobia bacterium]|nr:hypothetical protein [Terriglobia bacterium]
MLKRLILFLAFSLAFFSQARGQVCAATNEPVTINSTWSQEGCNAIYGSTPASCGISCYYSSLGLLHDVAVNANDSVSVFFDEDNFDSNTTIVSMAVADNALGSGTVNTSNSGSNTAIVAASGTTFTSAWVGGYILIQSNLYQIIGFTDGTHITASGNAGTLTGTPYVAGNGFTPVPQPNWRFVWQSGTRSLIGNNFCLLGSAYSKASGYQVRCAVTVSAGSSLDDLDIGFGLYRQTGGGASAGLDASSAWTTGTTSSTPYTCGSSTCYLQGTTPPITIGANDLVIGVGNEIGGPLGGSFSSGSLIPCDHGSGWGSSAALYFFAACSSTAAAGSITYTSYESSYGYPYVNGIFALKPAGTFLLSATPARLNLGNVIVGSSSSQNMTLTNTGTGSVTVSQATVTGPGFSISGLSLP